MREKGKINKIWNAADLCSWFNVLNHRRSTNQLRAACSFAKHVLLCWNSHRDLILLIKQWWLRLFRSMYMYVNIFFRCDQGMDIENRKCWKTEHGLFSKVVVCDFNYPATCVEKAWLHKAWLHNIYLLMHHIEKGSPI